MRTIRGRLAVGYAISLAVSMFVFAASIYVAQWPERFNQLDRRAELVSDLVADIVAEASQRLDRVVTRNPSTNQPGLDEGVAALLESVQDYVIILDSGGTILYTSEAPRASLTGAQLVRLAEVARDPVPRGHFGVIDLGPPVGQIRYYVRPIANAGPSVASILAGAPTIGVGAPRLLVGILTSAPIILIASIIVGYVIAGRNIKPVDTIIDEIEAITDGRSLHRRVVDMKETEELARLSTTLNAMLVRLERNFVSLRRFTADASHELKTPLTVLRAGVERAITHPATPPVVMEVLEETLVEVNRMSEIVDSLLTLARVDEGRAPLHLEPTDLRDLLGEIAETASILGEHASVEVSVGIPESPLVLPLDRARVRQLLLNLLTNATKYTRKGGSVAITCAAEADSVVVKVVDTGVGIAAGDLPHVFDRFWRADAARSRTGQRPGTGLGLAICQWIAEAHGGSIEVQSRRGEGTTFTVSLPRADVG